jgi:hypothetical protein
MPADQIQEVLDRIQKLSHERLQATDYAVFLGMTPKVARECESRRKQMSTLVERLASLSELPRIDASPHNCRTDPSSLKKPLSRAA